MFRKLASQFLCAATRVLLHETLPRVKLSISKHLCCTVVANIKLHFTATLAAPPTKVLRDTLIRECFRIGNLKVRQLAWLRN